MGEHVVEIIFSIGMAMIDLQMDPNASIPIQPNALAVIPQPLEHNFWDSISVVNYDLAT